MVSKTISKRSSSNMRSAGFSRPGSSAKGRGKKTGFAVTDRKDNASSKLQPRNKNNNKRSDETPYLDIDVYEASENNEHKSKRNSRMHLDDVEDYQYSQQQIDSEDDEEIDEDEAFNDSDEEKYGAFFESEEAKPSKKKHAADSNEISLNEEEQDSDEESEEDLEDDGEYMDLSAMLDAQDEDEMKDSKNKKSSALASSASFLMPQSDDEFNDMVDNDDALALQDEDDDEDELEEDDDELETKAQSDNLLSFVSSLDPSKRKRKRLEERTEAAEQSEFGLGPKLFGADSSSSSKRLALSDLISTVEDEAGFASVKKQVSQIVSTDNEKVQVVSAPLPKNIQDRYNRQAAYEETTKDLGKWVPIVKRNRESDTLSFPMNEAPIEKVTNGALVNKFEPITDLEKEINSLLETSGLNERKQRELEELELNAVSKKELKERQKQLASMRNLLFYQELKQKKIAKIKSKTYRKIHKKDAEKKKLESLKEMQNVDPEYVQAELERMETERARERMTLKHKNTGKWAKQLLGRKDLDDNSRQALQEQLLRHEQLRRKISGFDSDEESDADDIASGEDEDLDEEQKEQNEIDAAKRQLAQMADEVDEDSQETPTTGLFAMKFMQKAVQSQKEKARRDIDRARQELEFGVIDEENDADSDDASDDLVRSGRKQYVADPKAKRSTIATDFDEENDTNLSDNEDFRLQVSGPLSVVPKELQKPLFPVPTFEVNEVEENVFVGDANAMPITHLEVESQSVIKKGKNEVTKEDVSEAISTPSDPEEKDDPSSVQASEPQDGESEDDSDLNPWLIGLEENMPKARKHKLQHKKGKHPDPSSFNKSAPNLAESKIYKDSSKAKRNAVLWESGDIVLSGLEQDTHTSQPVAVKEEAKEIDSRQSAVAASERKRGSQPSKQTPVEQTNDDDSDADSDIGEVMVNQLDINKMSGLEVLKMAFENDNVIDDFEKEKENIIQRDAPKEEDVTLPGWGSWAGAGLAPKMNRVVIKSKDGIAAEKRKDAKLKHVILNEKRMKPAAKYMLQQLPHTFETREQYERSIRMPLGKEWNTQRVHAKLVQPKVQKRLGAIIKPLRFQQAKKK